MDASSIRRSPALPTATGRNKSSVRLETTTTNLPAVSNGTEWVTLGTTTVTYRMLANASIADEVFFIAPAACRVKAIREIHSTAGSDAGAVTIDVKKCTGTQAAASGTSLLTAAINAKATANTVQSGTLSATAATLLLAAGNRLAIDVTGTLTALAGVVVTVQIEFVS